MLPTHPPADQIDLAHVLTALGDDTRLAMIGRLSRNAGEMTCGQFCELGSKTALSYHLAKLRDAGIVRVRPAGTKRWISLRRAELDHRFPGFVASVLAAAQTAEARLLEASRTNLTANAEPCAAD